MQNPNHLDVMQQNKNKQNIKTIYFIQYIKHTNKKLRIRKQKIITAMKALLFLINNFQIINENNPNPAIIKNKNLLK